jgi:hypothetical protein
MASKRKRTHTCKKRARTLRKVHRRRRSGGMLAALKSLKSAVTKDTKELKKLMLVNAIYLKSMWIRTRNESVYKKYKEYYDKYVMKYGARVCDPFPSDIEKLLTKERVEIDKLHEMLNPSQLKLVDDDMINVQQLILDNPNEVNAKLREFLHDIGNEDAVQTSASAAQAHPPLGPSAPSMDDDPQYTPPPLVASAPPMDDYPQYPSPSYPPPYTPPYPPPPSQYAPPMDPQYGYFDIHGNRSIIPGNGRLRRI